VTPYDCPSAASPVAHCTFAVQIGKIVGCRVIAIAGTDEKCQWLTDELGADTAIN
jgi:hypothetical protein